MSATIEKPFRQYQRGAEYIGPRPKRWTYEEYLKLGEDGQFIEERVELFEGEIVTIPIQDHSHYYSIDALLEFIIKAFGDTAWVRAQAPLRVGESSCLEPDISAVKGHRRDYFATPTHALFIAEVSISSLHYDRNDKAPLYAKIQVPEYWILNIAQKHIEIMTDPIEDHDSVTGYSYATRVIRKAHETVSIKANPQISIPVVNLFR